MNVGVNSVIIAVLVGIVAVVVINLATGSTTSVVQSFVPAATFKVCASNATNTDGCDYTADGTADEVQIKAAFTACPAAGCTVVLSEGAFEIDMTNAPIDISSNETLYFQTGTELTTTGGSGAYLFRFNGSTTPVVGAAILGDGVATVSGSNNGLHIDGDVSDFHVGPIRLDSDGGASNQTAIQIDGDVDYGARDGLIQARMTGWDYVTWSTDAGNDACVSGWGTVQRLRIEGSCNNSGHGILLQYRDERPTKVWYFNDNTDAYTDLTNTYDGDITTGDAFTLTGTATRRDRLIVGFDEPISGLWFDISSGNSNTNRFMDIHVWNGSAWRPLHTVDAGPPSAFDALIVHYDGTIGATTTFETTGEVAFEEPQLTELVKSTHNAVASTYWYSLSFSREDNTPQSLTAVTLDEVLGFKHPRDNVVTMTMYDLASTGYQCRGCRGNTLEASIRKMGSHCANINSESTTTLTASNGRYTDSMWNLELSTCRDSDDTQMILRNAKFNIVRGIYVMGNAGIEMDGAQWPSFNLIDALVMAQRLEGIRVTGQNNVIRGMVIGAGHEHDQSNNNSTPIKFNNITTGSDNTENNFVDAFLVDPHTTSTYVGHGIRSVAGQVGTNYLQNTRLAGYQGNAIDIAAGAVEARNVRGYTTTNKGAATVVSATTSIAVTHGLAETPAAGDCTATPTENPTNAVAFWWIDTYTATQFTINVNADPGASNLDFAWLCVINP